MMKMKTLIVALAVTLLIVPCAVNAASVSISNLQSTYNPGDVFTIDFLVGDIAGLVNLDVYSVGVGITPGANASITNLFNPTADPNYVFFGNSFSFQSANNLPYQIAPSDAWDDLPNFQNQPTAPIRPSNVAGNLLFSLEITVSPTATPGEVYNFGIVDTPILPSLFSDFPDSNYDAASGEYIAFDSTTVDPVFDQAYSFQVNPVPIPAAVWLLGAGLLGLVGLRRKSN